MLSLTVKSSDQWYLIITPLKIVFFIKARESCLLSWREILCCYLLVGVWFPRSSFAHKFQRWKEGIAYQHMHLVKSRFRLLFFLPPLQLWHVICPLGMCLHTTGTEKWQLLLNKVFWMIRTLSEGINYYFNCFLMWYK